MTAQLLQNMQLNSITKKVKVYKLENEELHTRKLHISFEFSTEVSSTRTAHFSLGVRKLPFNQELEF